MRRHVLALLALVTLATGLWASPPRPRPRPVDLKVRTQTTVIEAPASVLPAPAPPRPAPVNINNFVPIRDRWIQLGGAKGFLGNPNTNVLTTPDRTGRYVHFAGGSIYWTPQSGAFEVHGDIRARWASVGWETTFLGYPTTDETRTPDGVGRYNHFQGGSIYWTPKTGAFEVHGAIEGRWAELGWERSFLGYPISNEYDWNGGRRSDFQNGYIWWTEKSGAHEVRTTDMLAKLQDAGVRSLATKLFADRVLDRKDMLSIFAQVSKDGVVSNAEFNDLRTLATNANVLHMPDYVRVLTNKVVVGDKGNGSFQGNALGNLRTGSRGQQLNNLVAKWFLGKDSPIINTKDTHYHYELAKGTLFGKGLNYLDIDQGDTGDCYFLAALAEVALRSPNTIRNMFVDNGDGTYTVRFYNKNRLDCVTVDKNLPANDDHEFAFANTGHEIGDANNKLWVALAEKAWVQLNASGWSGHGNVASYASISGGCGSDALMAIMGGTRGSHHDLNFDAIVRAWGAGNLLTVNTNDNEQVNGRNRLVSDHVYAILAVNAPARTITVFNPWGVGDDDRPAVVTLNWMQMRQSLNGWQAREQ
jgi:hypothetical protein